MTAAARFRIELRRLQLVNTDPQRRCYDGCNFSEALVWSSWEAIGPAVDAARAEARLAFWRDLNAYAVRERGEGARCEFRAVEEAAAWGITLTDADEE